MSQNLKRRGFLGGSLVASTLVTGWGNDAWSHTGAALTYPTRTIRLVAGYGTGGGVDLTARIIASALEKRFGHSVIVLNKPGANGIIGAEFVARAPANGYTLLIGPAGEMVVNPAIYDHLPYNTLRDFTPISEFVAYPLLLVVRASSPIQTVKDLVTYAKAHPIASNFSASNAVFWLTTELFKQKTGAPMTKVSYKGAGAALLAVVSGEVLCTISSPLPVSGQLRAGTVRVLAVTAPHRVSEFPDVPTMGEAGVPDLIAHDWIGLWSQHATPPAITAKLYDAMHYIMSTPEVDSAMKRLDTPSMATSPSEFTKFVSEQLQLWKGVATKANIKIAL